MEMTMEKLAELIGEQAKKAVADAMAKTNDENGKKLFAPNLNKGTDEGTDKRGAGQKMAARLACLALAKGDVERAAKIAEKRGDGFTAKSLLSTDFDAGGSLVPSEMSSEFFEVLRPVSVVRSLNPVILPMERGTLDISGLTAGAQATYRGEGQAKPATTVETGKIVLTEKLLIATIPVSNQLLRSANPRAMAEIERDLIRCISQAEDESFLNGDGTAGKPLGIIRQVLTSHSTAGTSSSVTLQKIDEDLAAMRKQVRGANHVVQNGAFFMHTSVEEDLMKLRSGDVLAFPEMQTGQRVGKYRYGSSNNVPEGLIGFGEATDIIIGESDAMRMAMSEEASYVDAAGNLRSAFANDMTVMRVTMGHDIALRYRTSWSFKTGVNYATLS